MVGGRKGGVTLLEKYLRSPLLMIIMLIYFGIIYVGVQEEWSYGKIFYPFFILFIIYYALIVFHNKKEPNRKITIFTYIPYELREDDEGMQWMTFKATRKVYIFYYFAIPGGIALYSIFNGFIPYFTVWLLVFFGVIQYLIYWFETKEILKEED